MSAIATVANAAWWAANLPAWAAFGDALQAPGLHQANLLHDHLGCSASCAFAREHRLTDTTTVDEFRRRVPIRGYDDLQPWIDRIVAGETAVLTADRVRRLMTSSGSTAAVKLLPYTQALQHEFGRAIGPWVVDLFHADPALMRGSAYWSISPVARRADERGSAVQIGFEEDTAYLGGVGKRLVDAVMAVPGDVRHCADVEMFRYVTLRHLLGRRDLRLISVWHPSFLDLLMAPMAAWWDRLTEDVASGRLSPPSPVDAPLHERLAHSLRPDLARSAELRRAGPDAVTAIWPGLRLISAWADASAAGPAGALAARWSGVRFQAKGLLATEAMVTIPLAGGRPVAVRSHFFEFLDDAGRARLVEDLRIGEQYEVVVTTGGGLWRYRLGDRVRVEGRVGRTPSLAFVGRADRVSDRFGEKLSEGFVASVIERLFRERTLATFTMLAPDGRAGGGYTLYVDERAGLDGGDAQALERALRENAHYAYCRDLGQLGPARVYRVRGDAYGAYLAVCVAQGMRLGDVKPPVLRTETDWSERLAGDYA